MVGACSISSRAASTSRRATAARSSPWRSRRPGSTARSSSPSGSAPGSSPSTCRAVDGAGALRVTASVGAASMPGSADGARSLDRRGRRGAVRGQARGQEPGQSAAPAKSRGPVLSAQGARQPACEPGTAERNSGAGDHAGKRACAPGQAQYSFPDRDGNPRRRDSPAPRAEAAARRHRSELQRLEDEAFGPPSRPGEPDFPEHEASASRPATAPPEGAVAERPAAPRRRCAAVRGASTPSEPAVEAAEEPRRAAAR